MASQLLGRSDSCQLGVLLSSSCGAIQHPWCGKPGLGLWRFSKAFASSHVGTEQLNPPLEPTPKGKSTSPQWARGPAVCSSGFNFPRRALSGRPPLFPTGACADADEHSRQRASIVRWLRSPLSRSSAQPSASSASTCALCPRLQKAVPREKWSSRGELPV